MKLTILTVYFFLISFVLIAQSDSGYSIEGDRVKKKINTDWMDKVFIGGNMGLSFGTNYSYLNLSPNLGYKLTEKMSVGTGVSYIYTKTNGIDFHDYGANVFTRYRVFDQIFAMAQYEVLSYDYGLERGRDIYSTVLVGGGLVQPIGANANFIVSVLYNLLYDVDSLNNGPYSSPLVVSGGVSLGF